MNEHHTGHPNGAKGLQGRCKRLRPELYLDIKPVANKYLGEAIENARAQKLADAGFQVMCNGREYWDYEAYRRIRFTDDDLFGLPGRLRRSLVLNVRAEHAQHLDRDAVVRALRWSRDRDCASITTTLFNDCYVGRLAHVECGAVQDLVAQYI